MTVSSIVARKYAERVRTGAVKNIDGFSSVIRIQTVLSCFPVAFFMGIRAAVMSKFAFCKHYRNCGLSIYELHILYEAFQV